MEWVQIDNEFGAVDLQRVTHLFLTRLTIEGSEK